MMSQNDGWEDVSHELKQPASDGWEDVSHELPKTQKSSGMSLEAGLRGFGDSATLGYRDNIAAATEPLMAGIYNAFVPDEQEIEVDDSYIRRRDAENKRTEQMIKENPGSYYTGAGAGAVATSLLPGLNIAKGATAGARVLNAGKTGAAMGLIANPGETEGELSGVQVGDRLLNSAVGAGTGAAFQGAGELAGKGFNFVKDAARSIKNSIKPKANADEIKAAAQALGIEVTPGMLDDAGFVERMEQALSESPSMWGRKVNQARSSVFDKTNQVADDLLSDSTNMTPFQVGEKVKSGIAAKVGERQAPLSMVFDEVAESTKNIPMTPRSIEATKRNMQNADGFKLLGEMGKGKFYLQALDKLENANDVKRLVTLLNQDISSSEGAERMVLSQLKEKLLNLEKNSITRAALQSAKNSGEGKQAALDIIGDLRDARGGWRSMMSDLDDVAQNTRLGKISGPDSFLDRLENVPSERIQDKLFNVNDKRAMDSIASQFPDEFNLLRQGKLKEILDSAQFKGNTNASKFLREVEKIDPEAMGVLFGQNTDKVSQMKTVTDAIPRNFNPSGTASQSMWNKEALMSNVTDIPRYLGYKALGSGKAQQVADSLIKQSSRFAEMSQKNPQAFALMVQNLMQNPKFQADPNIQTPPFMERLGNDPRMIETIQNDRLKEQLKKYQEQKKINEPVSQQEAQASFINGN